jgi:hypothetical protein
MTVQWRRTFRKERHSKNGVLTLAVLSGIFEKFGVLLTSQAKLELKEHFEVKDTTAIEILSELRAINGTETCHTLFDQKAGKKVNMIEAGVKVENNHNSSCLRRNNDLLNVVAEVKNRRNSCKPTSAEAINGQNVSVDDICIDTAISYHALCDEIYCNEWLSD